MDSILENLGLKYEDLTKVERETLAGWVQNLEQSALSVDKIRDYIHTMRDSVETELTKTSLNTMEDIFLKARLRNYMLMEAYLSTPIKAREALDRALAGLIAKK